ncbi:MAG TPA: alpha-L-fucosidase [Opitutaceae bacterium]|nr:alpha-L-fucosidase [Opitutaceae bacterium]
MLQIAPALLLAAPALLCAAIPPPAPLPATRKITPGPVAPNWPSLEAHYQCPEWFRDAKFGIWAHWSAQSVPEQGDWYARNMYIQGTPQNRYHVAHYGHPSEFGFMEIDHRWTAAHWDPEALMELYVAAGARYFVALANHEDNFDTYNSKYQAWNAVNVGPHRDIIGTWEKVAREHGLRFGVSNHSSHAWHWFQSAYGYDPEGPKAGVRYDAYRLTKADGKGKWWDGLDPRDLYGKPAIVMPDGITTIAAAQAWQVAHTLPWTEDPPPHDPEFANKWFFRAQDLIDKYDPDFLYLDNTGLPLGQVGLDLAADYYNTALARHGGRLDRVLTAKGLHDQRRTAVTLDFERTVPAGLMAEPFEASTCIGDWHYRRDITYKTVGQVVRILTDVVSKNGTFLLSIPIRGDGTIDNREVAILHGIAAWTKVNGEGIYGSRPWTRFGEGPTVVPRGRAADSPLPYTPQDFRFTTNRGHLYVFEMAPPTAEVRIQSLGLGEAGARRVADVEVVGSGEKLRWRQDAGALTIEKPDRLPCADVCSYRVTFQ